MGQFPAVDHPDNNMFKRILAVGLVSCSALAEPQFQGDSSMAKILQEQRFNAGGGSSQILPSWSDQARPIPRGIQLPVQEPEISLQQFFSQIFKNTIFPHLTYFYSVSAP